MKIFKFLLFSVLIPCFLFSFWNFSYANDYEHKNLDITANINLDWSIDVYEKFTTNFFIEKHGIMRFIPLNYTVEWKDFHIDISNISVHDKNFSTSRNNWNVEIKIWDANKTVIWEQIYPISYSAYWLIRNFSGLGYSELYWNLVWYDTNTSINTTKANIYLPKPYTWFTDDDFLITTDWTTKTIKDFDWSINWRGWNKITIKYDKKLPEKQWITISIKFPNNYFEFDHKKQADLIWHVWLENGFLSKVSKLIKSDNFIIIICIVWTILLYLIKIFNKLPRIKKSEIENEINDESPIVIRYTPPDGINCAEAWMLYNCLLEPTDITSLLYKWAIEWFIDISLEEQWTFNKSTWFIMTKLKDINIHYHQYEVDLFNSIFPSAIWSKKYVSTTSSFDVTRCLKLLREYGKSKWWIYVSTFERHKSVIWFIVAMIVFFLIFSLWRIAKMDSNPRIIISFIPAIMIAIIVIFGNWTNTPKQKKIMLTEEWKKITKDIIWYAKFIQACDENKLRLFLEKDPTFFDKTLPYAVAFWFETSFIKKITPILHELDIEPVRLNWNINEIDSISRIVQDFVMEQERFKEMEKRYNDRYSTYDSSSWFDSWSSFSWWWFSSGWGWWWWGTSSW